MTLRLNASRTKFYLHIESSICIIFFALIITILLLLKPDAFIIIINQIINLINEPGFTNVIAALTTNALH
jgi:hypothetical protein